MEKLVISKVIVCEGKYDKIKLESILDAYILTTDGFGIFKNEEKKALFRCLAAERGLIVLSDADGAGLVIRNYFNSIIPKEQLTHLYIPEIMGKEKRKSAPSKEGTLGVEGMEAELLRQLFSPFATKGPVPVAEPVTLADLYQDGFRGKDNSEEKRKRLLAAASLPKNLSAKALVGALNLLGGKAFYEKIKSTLSY